jgi:hypothetical protein
MSDLRFSRRWLWRMVSSVKLCRVVLVRTSISEELIASIMTVKSVSELGTTLAAIINWNTLSLSIVQLLLLTVFLACWLFSPWWYRGYVPLKRRFLQEPHGVTSQKTAFFEERNVCLQSHRLDTEGHACDPRVTSRFFLSQKAVAVRIW